MMSGYTFYIQNIIKIFTSKKFKGWGRKRTGNFAKFCYEKFGGELTLLEDGFIRSLDLGVNDSPSFSIVEDNIGIYYDATVPSKLENILNNYNFGVNTKLMVDARKAMAIILKSNISKYNSSSLEVPKEFLKDELRVLVIAQTQGDASLQYGMLDNYTTEDMIEAAIDENPNATVYLKVHPDVLSEKKSSDINVKNIKNRCIIIKEDINPIVLLKQFSKVYTKTSQMGFEALLVGCECVCFGMPFYAGWGVTNDKSVCKRRKRILSIEEIFAASYILYTKYYNPYSKKKSDIFDTLFTIAKYRDKNLKRDGYFFGFSRWKRRYIMPYFPSLNGSKIFFNSSLDGAKDVGLNKKNIVYIWGKKPFEEVEKYAKKFDISLCRVEDGFIRSVSLGSDLTKAYSMVVDCRGIYFDPTVESDLEYILNTYQFDSIILERAEKLQKYLVSNRISKYNIYRDKKIELFNLNVNQKIILVPGQVEDDASIYYGADGMTNLELLQKVKKSSNDAYIIYKPHPDVLAGNRIGHIDDSIALKYCNTIITDASIDSVLELVDEVHTMTSLVGFEALIREKKVFTYGLPFYAGWGVTTDIKVCQRRIRKCTLHELMAATFILYPLYIDPKTNQFCEIEVLLEEIDKEKNRYNTNEFYRLTVDIRNLISRKVQLLIKVVIGE